ncbi:MAG TPA: serine/threonine-protein kinase [Steroidobacteraceae bacterium]
MSATPTDLPEPDEAPTIQLSPPPSRRSAPGPRWDLGPGTVLCSRYELEKVIGQGGSSIVFRARDYSGQLVALKVLRAELRTDARALTCLKREFRQMQCLSHPGIVRVFDLDCDGDVWFIGMELVAGRTVRAWMETPGEYADGLRIIGGCCEALAHAHSVGILHGDLKPTNVMVAPDSATKLIDFGSAPSPDGPVVRLAPPVALTPLYASPQILAGKTAEPRDDIFSLACLSYAILTKGRHPFGGRPSYEDGRAKSAPDYARAIPREIFEVIECGLSAERERRPASASEFLRDLANAERRRRAGAASMAMPPHEYIDVAHSTALVPHGARSRYRPSSTSFWKRTHAGVRNLINTARLPLLERFAAIVERVRDGEDFRHVRPFVALVALVWALTGSVLMLRVSTHRSEAGTSAAGAAELPSRVAAISPAPAPDPNLADTMPQASRAAPAGRETGHISFDERTVHASASQPLVALSVKRLPAPRRRGAFVWRVEGGSARPGVDYRAVKPQVAHFIEGQAVRMLFIPLINNRAASTGGPRVFTVALEPLAGGPVLGRIARVTVSIDYPASGPKVYQARAQ